jgi:hypothetical protein
MPVSAAIKFTQGATVGTPGVALIGSTGASVVVTNGNDALVLSWTWTVVTSPPTSAIVPGTGGTGPSFTFTPDVTGCYLVQLALVGVDGSTATDVRAFGINETNGLLIPPFSGSSGSLNFSGVTTGWDPIMRRWLLLIESLQSSLGSVAVTITASSYAIPTTVSTLRANTVSNSVALTLPNPPTVPFDGWGFWVWIYPSSPSGGNPVTISPFATEGVMNPDTGAVANTTWTSATSGTRQGRMLRVEWWSAGTAWLISG